MEMKKLLKVTLSLLCVLAMTGCGSKENKNDTNSKKETVTQKNETKKGNSNYFKNFDKEYNLRNSSFIINLPSNVSSKHISVVDYLSVSDKNNKKLKIAISSSFEDKDISLEDIKSIFEFDREKSFSRIYDHKTVSINTTNDESSITLKKFKEALYESGTLSVTNYDKTPNYIIYRFLTPDEDGYKNIFELMICSDDYEEKDLKNIAEELISQIHETE